MTRAKYTVTIADNYGVYDEWDVIDVCFGEGNMVAVKYVDSRDEVAYKITGIINVFSE